MLRRDLVFIAAPQQSISSYAECHKCPLMQHNIEGLSF